MKVLTASKAVADAKQSRIRKANDIAGIGLLHHLSFTRQKSHWRTEFQALSLSDVKVVRVPLKGSAHDLHKSNAASVVGVNISVNFKDKTAKLDLVGADHSLFSLLGLRTWGYFGKAV